MGIRTMIFTLLRVGGSSKINNRPDLLTQQFAQARENNSSAALRLEATVTELLDTNLRLKGAINATPSS